MFLEGKVALITGASRGIGRTIALHFAKEAPETVLTDVVTDHFDSLKKEFADLMLKEPMIAQADVTKEQEMQQIADKALDKYGAIDILVNNAGVTRDGLLVRMTEKEWDDVLDINLKGTFLTTKAVVKIMMRQRHGRIINLASVVALVGNVGQANYSASKAGVIALTKTTAREFASRKILVNAIAPGFIDTDMTRKLPDMVKEEMVKNIPLRHMGTADDVAKAALFLASDLSEYITGQVINVDGGMVM